MRRSRGIFGLLAVLVAFLIGTAGCSSAPSAGVTVGTDTIVLDVRTPQEWDAGHLDGARLLDFNAGEFQAALPSLDRDAEYLIYCRSGNRAGQAKELMEKAGIGNVTNLGSLSDAAAATGLKIVS